MIAAQWLEATQDTLGVISGLCLCASFVLLIHALDYNESKLWSGIMLVISVVSLFLAIGIK